METTLPYHQLQDQLSQEYGRAMVGFEQYRPVLERAQQVLPPGVQVTLLADRGFEHGGLMRWWTVVTVDRSLSAQFEHTVLVSETGYEILTDRAQVPVALAS